MRVIRDAWNRAEPQGPGAVACIGSFDGIHRGQTAVLRRVVERAGRRGLTAAVVTFDPHPSTVLRPGSAPLRLTTPRQKERLLSGLGIELLAEVRFDRALAEVPAPRFVRDFLYRRLRVREIHVGTRFRFGRDRAGDLALLRALGEELGFEASGVEEVLCGGEPISSTRIRSAVADGEVEEAARMLGRPYALGGTVVRGAERGRTLGWPTVNLATDNELLPADGVYACRAVLGDGAEAHEAVSNIGFRPTVTDRRERVVESHLLDFDRDLYGQSLEIEFHRRLRGERKFGSLEELSRQIGRDAAAAREYFDAAGCWKQEAGA